MRKVKNVLFRLNLESEGIVNYDSNEQRFLFKNLIDVDVDGVTKKRRAKSAHLSDINKNSNYAKKNFYGESGDVTYKIKVSSNCLRNAIFRNDVSAHSTNITHHDHLLYSYIASPLGLLRGYVELPKNSDALKRKSPLTISSAEQTNDALSYLDFCSRSGEKNTSDDEKDTTIFKKETGGKFTYLAKGNIDLMQLQFVSCDPVFDRYSFNPDLYNIYKAFLNSKLPTFNSELGYYQIDSSVVRIPEYGIKLDNQSMVELVKGLLIRMLEINISRSNGFLNATKLEYKLVYDVLDHRFNTEDDWVEIKSKSDIESLNFEVEDFYVEEDFEEAKAKRETIESVLLTIKAESKSKKEASKKEASEARSKANAESKSKKEASKKDESESKSKKD